MLSTIWHHVHSAQRSLSSDAGCFLYLRVHCWEETWPAQPNPITVSYAVFSTVWWGVCYPVKGWADDQIQCTLMFFLRQHFTISLIRALSSSCQFPISLKHFLFFWILLHPFYPSLLGSSISLSNSSCHIFPFCSSFPLLLAFLQYWDLRSQ